MTGKNLLRRLSAAGGFRFKEVDEMKRLATIAMVFATTVALHAATITWSTDASVWFGEQNTVVPEGKVTAYFILAEHTTSSGIDTAYTFTVEGADAMAAAIGTKYYKAENVAVTDGKANANISNNDVATLGWFGTGRNADWTIKENDRFVLMLAITDDDSGRTYYNLSKEAVSVSVATKAAEVNFTFIYGIAGIVETLEMGGGWSVPEPTSGMMLLVGAAMLALRRKRK